MAVARRHAEFDLGVGASLVVQPRTTLVVVMPVTEIEEIKVGAVSLGIGLEVPEQLANEKPTNTAKLKSSALVENLLMVGL